MAQDGIQARPRHQASKLRQAVVEMKARLMIVGPKELIDGNRCNNAAQVPGQSGNRISACIVKAHRSLLISLNTMTAPVIVWYALRTRCESVASNWSGGRANAVSG